MVERFNASAYKETDKPGTLPFITISREYGCPAKEVADRLVKKLNDHLSPKSKKWSVISKEIMEQAARELNIDRKRIEKIFLEEKRSTIDEILDSFSEKYYKSDRKIIKTLASTIKDFALRGHIIIIGRNGVGITSDFKNGIHIRLVAPIDWRLSQLLKKGKFSTLEEAKEHAEIIDYKRSVYIRTKTKRDPVFDVYYNTEIFSSEQIAESIIYHLGLKLSK